jgi:hypothetical protein
VRENKPYNLAGVQKMISYLVTTDKSKLPQHSPIVMVDGTVPGWTAKATDLHFDHHRPGGADIQLQEIEGQKLPDEDFTFVTTQVDADACAAAAWLLLEQQQLDPADAYEARAALTAIAYDCDHLGLPSGEEWDKYRLFAAKVVAAMKETGNKIAQDLGLLANRKEWKEEDRIKHASWCFELGTQSLVHAAIGMKPYPGENGEADPYFERMESQRSAVYENCRTYQGCAIFDQRPFQGEYVDPRLLVEWCRENHIYSPVTLTVRDGSRLPNSVLLDEGLELELFSCTLGSVPLHAKGSPKYSDRRVWEKLAELERNVRTNQGLSLPETNWGGRNEVGGSGWRDPVICTPEQIIDTVDAVVNA